MASQLQTPSHGFGGASSIFDTSPGSDNTKAFSGVLQPTYPVAAQTAATNPPTTWYRYWNEQYNRYFFWQENNSISTWDLPPEGDIVVDYTTKEVVSGPGSSSSSADGADSAVQQQQRQDSGHSNTYPPPDDSISQTVLGEYDQSVSSSAAAGLFGPATGGPAAAAATVDFDLLARGARPADVSSRVFEESSPADLSWLHKGMPGGGSISGFNHEPAQQQQQHSGVPAPSSFSPADGDNLFPSLSASMRSALDEVASPQGVVTNDYGITETYPHHRQSVASQRPRPMRMMSHQQHHQRHQQQQQPTNILDKKVQEEHDRLIAERMQAELDREYEERLTEAPLPCEAAQHKQSKKEKKMGKMPKGSKPLKTGSASVWGSSPSPSPPKGGEEPLDGGHASNAEDELAHEMAAHGIVLKKAKMRSQKAGRQQQQHPKAIPIGRK